MGFILIIFEAFLLSNLFSKHQLTHSNSFLSGFIFVLFLSRTPSHLGFHPALFALLLSLFSLKTIFENYKAIRSYNLLLTSSLMLSLASLFIPAVILLFPALWMSLLLFQSFSWRSIPISIIGFLIPYLFIASLYFWMDQSLLFIDHINGLIVNLLNIPQLPSTYEFFELFTSGILLLLATSFIIPRIGSKTISIRKKTSFMVWCIGLIIIVSFISTDTLSREIVFIPFAALLGFYFSSAKRQFWPDLFISLTFILILFQNYRILFYA